MARYSLLPFKDYDQTYYDHDRTPEEQLYIAILATFVGDALKIASDYYAKKDVYKAKASELAAPAFSAFMADLHGGACERYCDNLDLCHKRFVENILVLIPEELIKE